MMDHDSLFDEAKEARKASYSPYSHFAVGAALLTEDGKVFKGCNIENSSYPVTNCAERTALFKAVSEGERKFSAIAVVGGEVQPDGSIKEAFCPPCGMCRQALSEFCKSGLPVIIGKEDGTYIVKTLGELLPEAFFM